MKMTRLLHQQHSDTEFAQYVPPPHTHTHTVCGAQSVPCLRVSPGVSGCEALRASVAVSGSRLVGGSPHSEADEQNHYCH